MAGAHGITRKHIDRADWRRLADKRLWIVDEYEERFSGCAALIEIVKVHAPLDIAMEDRTIRIADDGYLWYQWLPLEENWAMTCMLDERERVVEWYFDVTAQNGIEKGRPYYDDLLLDVVAFPDGKTLLLDEDELDEARREGLLTEEQVLLAYHTAKEITEGIARDVRALEERTRADIEWMRRNARFAEEC